jgi:hypothetical protein
VISVILYGRNDAHGYNLHRRAALSLNSLAEVLTGAGDEIVFVDYNTPDELPTFIEAIDDTLTRRCLELLRVFRVPAALHRERFEGMTHLPALEPVARNAAVRRGNPANRWLLSTNTDMLFLPHDQASLSEICARLPDGFYGLPRFELPEWLWEQLPRSDPQRAMRDVRRLGPRLCLDEPTLNHEWVRFDAPGDFQLCLREDFLAIDGCDEAMLLGWHVDSNLSRRMFLLRGSIQSLENHVSGYHCNHSRTPTVYHDATTVQNDLERFFVSVERAELPAQRESWGLADAVLEEVPVGAKRAAAFRDAVVGAIPGQEARVSSDLLGSGAAVTYDSGHVFSFVVDSIAVSGHVPTVGYLGTNEVLESMLVRFFSHAGSGGSTILTASDETGVDHLADAADLFVVDLGLDANRVDDTSAADAGDHRARFPRTLLDVLAAFERLVHRERRRLEQGAHPRRFVLVNSATLYTNAFVLSQLDCSYSTPHSRVRRATVKREPIEDDITRREWRTARRLARWESRPDRAPEPMRVRVGERLELGELDEFGGFGEGWGSPDPDAIWTRGARSELELAIEGVESGRHSLAIVIGRVGVGRGEILDAALVIGERIVGTRRLRGGTYRATWRVGIPVQAISQPRLHIAFEFIGPPAWELDDRQLGLQIRSLGVERHGVRSWWNGIRDRTLDLKLARRLVGR